MDEFIDLGGRLTNRRLIATVDYQAEYQERPVVADVGLAVPIYDRNDDGTGGTDLYRLRFTGARARVLLRALMPADPRWAPEEAS